MKCRVCECEVSGEAEAFLHEAIHQEQAPEFRKNKSLHALSGLQVKRLAHVLETYAQIARVKAIATTNPDVAILRGALRQAVQLLTARLDLADITDEEKSHRLVMLEILGKE